MTPRGEGSEDDGPWVTALAAFASSDSSMTASSEAEGTVSSGRAPSAVVAILFYFLTEKRSKGTGGGYVIHVICLSVIRHVTPQWPECDWPVGRMVPELRRLVPKRDLRTKDDPTSFCLLHLRPPPLIHDKAHRRRRLSLQTTRPCSISQTVPLLPGGPSSASPLGWLPLPVSETQRSQCPSSNPAGTSTTSVSRTTWLSFGTGAHTLFLAFLPLTRLFFKKVKTPSYII